MDKKYLKLPPGNGPVFKMYVQVGLGGVFLNITFVNRPANWGIDSWLFCRFAKETTFNNHWVTKKSTDHKIIGILGLKITGN